MKDIAAIFFVMAERDKKVSIQHLMKLGQIEIRKQVLADMKGFNPWLLYRMLSTDD